MSELENYLNTEEPKTDLEILSEQLTAGNPITLYKKDTKGKTRQWSIHVFVQPMSKVLEETATIWIETGLVDGGKVPQTIDITEGKNLGKNNATTPYTQALAEAIARVEQQLRSGYVRDLKDLKDSGTLGSGIMSPMLAHKYDPEGKQSSSKTLEKMGILSDTIHVQPKLDGQRCLIKLYFVTAKDGFKAVGTMYTRKGDVRKVQFDHIIDELLPWFGEISVAGDSVVLDGELFSNELSFNEANGILNKKELKGADLAKAQKIKFHLYDAVFNAPYKERYDYIRNFAQGTNHIKLIPSFEITATDKGIKEKLEEFLAEGHEGLMIRRLDTPYEHKRSWQLVKAKLFEDAEFEIVDMELNAMGRLGGVIVKLPAPVTDRDGKVLTTFKAGLGKGISHEEGMKLYNNKNYYIGKMATIEFFGKSEYAIPRFPKFKTIREE